MRNRNQNGSVAIFVSIILLILLVTVAFFAQWAYRSRQDYKNNVDQKINSAVAAAKTAQANQDQAAYQQEAKSPNNVYHGSPTYGSITFNYPKTWSGYVDTTDQNQPIEGYFYPGIVPGLQSNTAYALRIELVSSPYSQVLQQFSSQIAQGTIKATAYVPPEMVGSPNVQPGTKLDGAIITNQNGAQQGSMVVIQVRDKTLEISTQSTDFLADFNNIVLHSLTFSP